MGIMNITYLLFLLYLCGVINCDIYRYLENVATYLGYNHQSRDLKTDVYDQSVPYEVSELDEQFIIEAAQLTGTALSELDSCQHRVVLKLQTTCNRLNDEQLAKMAVMLLNCQAAAEGRKIYPCTDEMALKDCTSTMNPDIWNSYHLMSNRVRAVCYSVRQVHFRGLAEHTVNSLMATVRYHQKEIDKITKSQSILHELVDQTLQVIANGQEELKHQQKDLQMAQFHNQLVLEDNINRLVDEKRLILDMHKVLRYMSEDLHAKFVEAFTQLARQGDETLINQKKVFDDLIDMQNKAEIISERLEESSNVLLEQTDFVKTYYANSLTQLSKMNATIHSLLSIIEVAHRALDQRIAWVNKTFGDVTISLECMFVIMWHLGFLLTTMVVCSFLNVGMSTRYIVATCPPLNLALTVNQYSSALNSVELLLTVGTLITVQTMYKLRVAFQIYSFLQAATSWFKQKLCQFRKKDRKVIHSVENTALSQSHERFKHTYSSSDTSEYDPYEGNNSFSFSTSIITNPINSLRSRSRTPINNGTLRNGCTVKTRLGSICKLSALSGRDFCHRHQFGDSNYGD